MGFIDRLTAASRELFRPQNAQIRTSQDLADAIAGEAFGAQGSLSGETITAERSMRNSAVFGCVRIACNATAHLPLVLFKRDGIRVEPDLKNSLFKLLHDRPNENQTAFEWREIMQRDLELRGNAYALISRGLGKKVQELIRLHPDLVKPKQDSETLKVTYDYKRADGKIKTYDKVDILHIRGMGDNGFVGQSVIQQHRDTIGEAFATQRHGSRFFSNGAKPLGVIEMVDGAKISEATQTRFRSDWESTYAGGDNAHKTLLLPFGMKYSPVSISMKDAEYLESRRFGVTEIARIFAIPPHKIGDLTQSTNNNIEHQGIEFVVDSMIPRLKRWEQALHRDLLDSSGDSFFEFNVNALLRGTARDRAEALQIQRRNGIINANEWRSLEKYNNREDPGGDEYVVEANMRIQDGTKPPLPGAPAGEPAK